jgi:hypothetical protein
MNLAQMFMALQIVTCLLGTVGFLYTKQPWAASVWFFYALANIGWFMVAGGKA